MANTMSERFQHPSGEQPCRSDPIPSDQDPPMISHGNLSCKTVPGKHHSG